MVAKGIPGRNVFMDTTNLSAHQQRVLQKHMRAKMYDRNGTGPAKPVVKCVFVPCGRNGEPNLILLCAYGPKDRRGRFEYCVFTDGLHGRKHVPSDSCVVSCQVWWMTHGQTPAMVPNTFSFSDSRAAFLVPKPKLLKRHRAR